MDHEASIKLRDGSRSEEKRPKIQEVEVGQRITGAMLSVQSEAIDLTFVFSWLPPNVLTGWPAQPKSSFINQRFGWLIIQNLLLSNQDLEGELQPQLQVQQLFQNKPTKTSSKQSKNIY